MIEDHIKFDHPKIKIEEIEYDEDDRDDSIEDLLSLIEKNNKDERKAIGNYFLLLNELKYIGVSGEQEIIVNEIIKKIEEIISDELEHSESLNNFVIRLSGIQPAKD